MEFSFSVNGEMVLARSLTRVDDNQVHTVNIKKIGNVASLQLDSQDSVTAKSNALSSLNIEGSIYIGK